MKKRIVLFVVCLFATIIAVNSYGQDNKERDNSYYSQLVSQISDAIKNGDSKQMKQIVVKLNLDSQIERGLAEEALYLAAERGQEKIVKILLDKGVNVNAQVEHFYRLTPLHAAVSKNNKKIEKLLISKGADVNIKYNPTLKREDFNYVVYIYDAGITPLIMSTFFNSIDSAKILLKNGAAINGEDNYGNTPLWYANTKEMAEFLISQGVRNDGKELFHFLNDDKYIEIVKLLVEKGADVNVINGYGETPIFFAKNKEIAEFLISKGARIDNMELFHFLADDKDIEIAKLLVEIVSDVNVKGFKGRTPLFYARNKEIAEILISKGADVNMLDLLGETPLDFVKDEEIKQVLIKHGAKSGKDLK